MTTPKIVTTFKSLYKKMDAKTANLQNLAHVYASDLHFEDSFHQINGIHAFERYCQSLFQNLLSIRFDFHQTMLDPNQAMLTWTMCYRHRSLKRGKEIRVDGASHLQFNQKVFFHKDYFDGGQLIYEHLPVFGRLVTGIKQRVGNP